MSQELKSYFDFLESHSQFFSPLLNQRFFIPRDKIKQLFELSSKFNLSQMTKYHSLHVFNRFYSMYNPTIILLSSLLIGSKLYQSDPLTFHTLQPFTNLSKSSICMCERKMLMDSGDELSEITLYEWITFFVELGFHGIDRIDKEKIIDVCCVYIDFLYLEGKFLYEFPVGIISASVILCALQHIPSTLRNFQIIEAFSLSMHIDIRLIHELAMKILESF